MGQQGATANPRKPVRKVVGTSAVLAGLVVFQAFAADRIAEREKEIIMIIVMGVEKLLCFDHQVAVIPQFVRGDLELGRLVGENVEEHLVVRARGQVDALVVDACIQRRVHKRIQRRVFELDQVSILRFHFQRASEFPPLRQPHRGRNFYAPREMSRRIEKHGVPCEIGEIRRDAARFRLQRRQILKVHFQRGYILRHVNVEGEDIDAIADPVDGFAVGRHH